MESNRVRVRRLPKRASYDRAVVHAILDEARICHVGFSDGDGQTFVLPTIHTRIGDSLYIHGARGNRHLQAVAGTQRWCIEATIVDGLVLARSAFHHSMNFRSVVVFGTAVDVDDDDEKRRALHALVEKVQPGRSALSRPPNAKELRLTRVTRIDIEEASAKIRTGGPVDDDEDMGLPHWAGVIPLSLTRGTPIRDGEPPPHGEPEPG